MPHKCLSLFYSNSPGPSERKGPWPVPHYDAEGRLSSLEWHGNGDAASRRVDYGYDSEGRIAMATNGLFAAMYSYHGGGYDQGYTLAFPSGATLVRHVVRNAHRTHPIESVQNFIVTASGVTNALPSFAYALDGLMRPVQRNADEFAYDARSQLTSATLRSANTNAFAYVYDTAGNRTAASDSGASVAYTANQLNQYESVAGTSPAYDIDGNLLTNGVWSYAWDVANRLAAACSNGVCVVSNAYDALSRRVLKVTPTETRTFLYDGWNLMCEEVRDNATGAIAETRDYYWGRDLSGALQGAGGVGGLLAYTRNGALRVPVYDHIGNVVAVVDDSGAIVAAYEYAPFGNIVAQSGLEADEVPFRFSTKYFDPESGLYYYGYRFYAPLLGRWINRDPIWEDGGANLYEFCRNGPLHNVDYLGKASILWGDRSRSRRCECIATKRTKSPVSLDRPLSFDMRYPTEFDHLASPETYLGQENWFEQNYSGWLHYAVEFFGKEINDWIKAQCARGNTPSAYNSLTSRISVDPYYGKFKYYIFRVPDPESNETKYGDAPQSRRSAGSILGRFYIDIATPVSISYTKTNAGNAMFIWEAELYFGDTLGTQPEEDGWLLGMFSSVFPSRNVKRAKWTITSGGICCED